MGYAKPPTPSPHSSDSHKNDWFVAMVLGICHAMLVRIVYLYVPDPYMDEIFHIRQTRRYCSGNWSWDPMITTPPALYILGMPFCNFERYTNSVLIVFAFVGFCRFRRMFTSQAVYSSALATALLAVLLHSSLLFYTDLLSVCAVVWGFSLDSPFLSALTFGIAVLTRQTNIIWAGFSAAIRLFRGIDSARPFFTFFRTLFGLTPFIILALSFIIFVFINGGIVLGDASAHYPCLHLAQFLYLALFIAGHAWPHALSQISKLLSHLARPLPALLVLPVALAVQHFAFDHPYLLADNRHVTFYMWRWWLSDATHRVLLTPFFICSFVYMFDLSSHLSPLVRILFSLCSFAVVVPAHLIEPRYFIVPYVLWRLSAKSATNKIFIITEIISQLFVFASVFLLFLLKPFEWGNEPGVKQRFMW
ncbi:DIE2/ALG10 family protein [Necator americanus]|uniref:Dol-P-Glc:Glc(2)Man(9)GlcNAc(2)-PP-Dol alpha-1,2-glucosyltransferase n=1 Tax=Necator americanus TaxID=51031 RepID=W2TCT9_NECAM|nr:DIE2/ALG10 family protein [Necator americanus]ETN78807.1 DIE2/ALG10 family protein [Necator americanus]